MFRETELSDFAKAPGLGRSIANYFGRVSISEENNMIKENQDQRPFAVSQEEPCLESARGWRPIIFLLGREELNLAHTLTSRSSL